MRILNYFSLQEFKKMIQPKISEEKATELYSKLVEDGNRFFLQLKIFLTISIK